MCGPDLTDDEQLAQDVIVRNFDDHLRFTLEEDERTMYSGNLWALQVTWNASLDLLFPLIDNLWKDTSDGNIGEIREKLISLKTEVIDW